MRRGDIYLVDFEPSCGSEVNKARPAILVTNDGANSRAERIGRGVLAVVPLTSNLKRVYPFQVVLPAASTGLNHDSKAQAEQVKAADLERFYNRIGSVSAEFMAQIDDALRVHLGLLSAPIEAAYETPVGRWRFRATGPPVSSCRRESAG